MAFTTVTHARAATLAVPAGGSLQSALNAAQPGDVITLEPGVTYVGNFVLPNKGAITDYIVVRSAAPDAMLPRAGLRMTPAYSALLPKIKSPNTSMALRTAASANHWKLMFLEFQANQSGAGDIIALGAGDSTQTDVSQVPHHLVLDRLFVHGDPVLGQKRGIALNSSDTSIINSHISDCKAVGQDTQAIQGHNGPGNYLIENNYLEGAAENFMLGGADPSIPNLVTSNVLFRRNYLSKPLAWRDAIATGPTDVVCIVSSGGLLAAGTYAYRVVSRVTVGQNVKAVSAPSAEVQVTIAAGTSGGVALTWSAVPGATDYLVYGRTPAAENIYWPTATPAFTDIGGSGAAGTPVKATRWAVKNLFELKNARNVVVEGNVMENLWVADQSGYAIQFTPRNQYGTAPWSTVEQVTVRGNLLRHVAGGVNVLGHDNLALSGQTNHVAVHGNLFEDVTAETWGTGSRPVQLGAGPDAITIDHNTFITTDSTIVYLYGGPASSPTPITNTSYTNNMSKHNTYGINGSNSSSGMPAILAYMPDGVVTGNVLAGGTASKYPAGNLFPTAAQWQAAFVDYAAGDYRLANTSPYKGAGTDGADLGADIDIVLAHARGALAGDVTDSPSPGPPGSPVPRLTITTTTLADGTAGQAYAATLLASGGVGTLRWVLASGAFPDGITLDRSGRIDGVPTDAGTFAFSVQVLDSQVPPDAVDEPLSLVIAPRAVVIATTAVPSGTVGLDYRASLIATGGSGTYLWSVIAGGLPAGLSLSASGLLAGIPAAPGGFDVTVQAADTVFPQNVATRPLSIGITAAVFTVDMPARSVGIVGQPYQLTASANGQIGIVTWSIASGVLPPGLRLNASTGVISGVPTVAGTFTALVQAEDVGTVTRANAASATIVINPKVAIVTSALPAGNVGSAYSASLAATGFTGVAAWSVIGGSVPSGLSLDASGTINGSPTTLGSSTFTVRAADSATPANDAARSFTIVVGAREIVLYASGAKIVGSAWSRVVDTTAADGARVWNPDRGASRVKTASASPSSYVELTFQVEAGVPYHLWLRASAQRNSVSNDSVHVQFSSSVDANGSGIYRIGTKQSAAVVLEDGSGAGVSGWGWQDDRYGAGALGPPIYFQQKGTQTIRLQQREDGISIDHIVLSAGKYVSTAPGALRNDTVILAR